MVNALQVVFIVLKLVGLITWSWWWVMSPMILGGVLVIILALIGVVLLLAEKD